MTKPEFLRQLRRKLRAYDQGYKSLIDLVDGVCNLSWRYEFDAKKKEEKKLKQKSEKSH